MKAERTGVGMSSEANINNTLTNSMMANNLGGGPGALGGTGGQMKPGFNSKQNMVLSIIQVREV
jgi:hypothetical protein